MWQIRAIDPEPTWSGRPAHLPELTPGHLRCASLSSQGCLVVSFGEAMRRREFITLIGGVIVARPLSARASEEAAPVIGVLSSLSREENALNGAEEFFRALAQAGYVDGENVAFEYRFANGRYDQLPTLAGQLVEHRVAIIATFGGEPAALAAKAATSTTPIVFGIGGDPVKAGLVASISRPGGNATGISLLTPGMEPKRLELLHEIVPKSERLAAVVNPNNPLAETQTDELQAAAKALGIELVISRATSPQQIEAVFATLAQQQMDGLVITFDPLFVNQRDQLVALAARLALPTICGYRGFAKAGGLMTYGSSPADATGMMGRYTARILSGAKPGDLPVWQAVKVELLLNLKTAKALGVTIPLTILGRADEVIE